MANFNYSVKQIARETLPHLIDNLVFPNLVYRDSIPGNAAKLGDTVSVRCPVRLTANEFDPDTGVTPENLQKDTVDVKLDHLATVDMQVGAIEAACDFDSVVKMFIEPAAAALAEKINAEGLALYRDIPTIAGTPGTTPDDLDDIAAAAYALDIQKVPSERRCAVWSPLAASKLKQVPAIVNADKCGSSTALRTGSIGQVLGIENYMSQAVCVHTNDDAGTVTPDTRADLKHLSFTGGEEAKVGDILQIGSKYVPVTKVEDGVIVFDKDVTIGENDTVAILSGFSNNLIFHPNAFAFVTRPLQAPAGVESYVTSYNGIALRVVRGYDITYKREILSMDVLYAFKTIYPELAVRYLG